MKYYFICFLDYMIGDAIHIKDCYKEKQDALNNLEKVAIEYVREFQGKQQAEKCKIDKTPEELLMDIACKEGLYIKTVNDTVILYEKVNYVLPGRFYNSNDLKVNKIGLFTISEYNFNDSMFRLNRQNLISDKNEKLDSNQKSNKEDLSIDGDIIANHSSVLDELKKIMLSGFKLKSIPLKMNVTDVTQEDETIKTIKID